MEEKIDVSYYCFDDSLEVHTWIPGNEFLFVYYKTSMTRAGIWELQSFTDGMYVKTLPDYTVLQEEEIFQESLVYEGVYDFYFTIQLQKHVLMNCHKWKGAASHEDILQY